MEKLLSSVKSEAFQALPDKQTKELFLCSSTTVEDLSGRITPSSPNFGLLLAIDARSISDTQVGKLAGELIDKGLAYLCAWGPDCERIHDGFDHVMIQRDPEPMSRDVIMTTSHSDESLEETLWFFMNCAFPEPQYEPTCKDWIVAVIGSAEWEKTIRREVGPKVKR